MPGAIRPKSPDNNWSLVKNASDVNDEKVPLLSTTPETSNKMHSFQIGGEKLMIFGWKIHFQFILIDFEFPNALFLLTWESA